jgi:hypothetical protein
MKSLSMLRISICGPGLLTMAEESITSIEFMLAAESTREI